MTKPEIIAFVVAPLWALIVCGGLTVGYLWFFRRQPAVASSSAPSSTYRLTMSYSEAQDLLAREVSKVSSIIRRINDQAFRAELFAELDKALDQIRDAETEEALNRCYNTLRFLEDAAQRKAGEEFQAQLRAENAQDPTRAQRHE